MAKKEYTKGDVLNIFGRVIGKGIEFSGEVLLILSKGIARAAQGAFWIAGKHVDMIMTLKDLKKKKFINAGEVPLMEISRNPGDLRELIDRFTSVEQALSYSQSVFENGILPKEEILKVDNQALIMAQAIKNVIERAEDTKLRREGIKIADTFLKVAARLLKYHSIGDKLQAGKTKELLARASGIMGRLVSNRQDTEEIEKNEN